MLATEIFPKDMMKDKVVFVTGGGSGINLGIAKHFAALGAKVGICGRRQEKLDEAARELCAFGGDVFAQSCDVRDYPALAEVIENCHEALGAIDVLVCAAAGNFPCPAEVLSPNGFKSVVDIDLRGSFHACHAAVEQLKETKGCIIFISAGQAFLPYPLQCHVGAAKAGVDNLMKNLALEWGKHGIRSNSIAPGPIADTEGARRLAPPGTAELIDEQIPLRRHGTIDEVAQAAVFLASPLASYITGTVLVVDGGQNLPGSGAGFNVIQQAWEQQAANPAG
jgi:NAD(P)-dependent dehydrogenase (short-subunit alcohol dehydrogenase family)